MPSVELAMCPVHPMTETWRRMAGTCLNCRRPFSRNVRRVGLELSLSTTTAEP
jgi:hypothetical protein